MSKVFICNKGSHDYSDAEDYGQNIFITEGIVKVNDLNMAAMLTKKALKDSSPDDFILIVGPASLNAILCSLFMNAHKKLNLLVRKHGKLVRETILP